MGGKRNITVICGHYGCGKTNLSLNLALECAEEQKSQSKNRANKAALLDMDIVNPYFRSSEYGELLARNGIELIAPVFSGTTLDTPTLSPEIRKMFSDEFIHSFVDAGGDDAGSTALGTVKSEIAAAGYEMIYVINRYRMLSQIPERAAELLREIEEASGLEATAVVNNSHLGVETTLETVEESLEFAEKASNLCGLPLLYNTIPDFAAENIKELPKNFKVIKRYVKFPWEEAEL